MCLQMTTKHGLLGFSKTVARQDAFHIGSAKNINNQMTVPCMFLSELFAKAFICIATPISD